MAALGLEHHRLAIRAHARIHHAHEDGALGPVVEGLIEAVGRLPDVVGRDLVGQILQRQCPVHPEGDPLHGGDGAILEAEVGLEHQSLACEGASPHQGEGEDQGAGKGTNIHIRTPCEDATEKQKSRRPECHFISPLQPLMPEWGEKSRQSGPWGCIHGAGQAESRRQ
ncbi:hypothetical protein D3C80_1437340 [compost metagenome]